MLISVEHPDRTLGKLLRAGVLLSAAVVLTGGIWYLASHATVVPDYRIFHGEPRELSGVTGIVRGVLHGQASHLIQFGLLLMILTPVARVGLSVIIFALERDRLYVVLTLIVFATLVSTLLWRI